MEQGTIVEDVRPSQLSSRAAILAGLQSGDETAPEQPSELGRTSSQG
jgi:hypothetical protein